MSSLGAFSSGGSSGGPSGGGPSEDHEQPRSSRPEAEETRSEQAQSEQAQSEQARLRALRRYEVVGTEPEPNFDRITRVAASLFDASIALINFIAEDRQWYKSTVGVESGGRSLGPTTFCLEAIRSEETTVIEDAAETERFAGHPLVEGEPGVRCYAGAPLETPDGYRIGTLCVLDEAPRSFSEEEARRLEDLAEMVMSELERRRQAQEQLQEKDERLQSIAENVSEGIYWSTPEGKLTYANQAFAEMFGCDSAEEVLEVDPEELYADPAEREDVLERTDEQGGLEGEDIEFRRADGSSFTGRVTDTVVRGEDGEVAYYGGVVADVTERKRREETLRQQKEELRHRKEELRRQKALLEQTQRLTGAWEADLRTGEVSWSEEGYRIHELDPSVEMSLEKGFGFPHPEFLPEVREAFDRCVETGEPYDLEHAIVTAEGNRRWVRTVGAPVEVEGGEVVKVAGAFQDITDRKRREQELKESRRELRKEKKRIQAITENVSDGIYRSTEEDGIVYANSAFVEMFGYRSLQELREAGTGALYADPSRREELFEEEAREGELGREEVCFRRKDGTTFTGLLSTQRVEGEEEGKTYFDGAITDITERKRHEQKLKRRRKDIEVLYESTRGVLGAESQEAIYDRIHAVLRRVFDYDLVNTEHLDGETIRPVRTGRSGGVDVPSPSPRPIGGNSIAARVLREGETVVVKDLGSLENDVSYGALRMAAGVPIGERGVIVVGRAGKKTFDRFNLRLIEVLAGYAALVLDRLRREEKLREAKVESEEARREAEKAQRMQSTFLANMSHEIRTPLTSIIGFAEAVGTEATGLELSEDSALPKYADLIEKGGKRLLETLNGVLNLSKLEAGQMELSAEPVGLTGQAQQVAEELRPEAEEKQIDLGVQAEGVQAEDVYATADEGGIQIVVRNLLSNAIKYTGEGGAVWVRTYREEGRAVLEVEDTGIGMEPSMAEDLFEPFRQASEGWGREYEGTGVGLAVTREAVEQMGGRIEVETEEGVGTCFAVRLPRAEEEA